MTDNSNKKLAIRSIAYILTSFVVSGLSILTTPIYARLMGTGDYGVVSVFSTWFQAFATFICLQLFASLLTVKANKGSERVESFSFSVVIGSILSFLLLTCFAFIFRRQIASFAHLSTTHVIYVCICAFGISMVNMFSLYCITVEKVKIKILFSLLWSVFMTVVSLLLVWSFEDKAEGRILGYTVTYALVAVILVFYFVRKPRPANPKMLLRDLKYSFLFGAPLIPHLLANIINSSADRIFIIKMLNEEAAGIYSLVYSIGMLAIFLADATNDAWKPWYYEKSKELKSVAINRLFVFYSVTIGMCSFGVMMLSKECILLMGGQKYISGIDCVGFVSIGIFFLFLYRFPLNYEQLREKTIFVAVGTIISACINLVLNYYLISAYNINGAAIATSISYFVLWIMHEIIARLIIKRYEIRLSSYVPSIAICLSGFLLSFLTRNNDILRFSIIGFFCFGYVFYFFAFKNHGGFSDESFSSNSCTGRIKGNTE